MKNLSALDGDLYNSLTNKSLLIIDHVEATILSKRQIIFFFDRLYSRIRVIVNKIKPIRRIQLVLEEFAECLLMGNCLGACNLQK